MSLAFKILPKENYFSGNPVVFELQSDSEKLINYSVKINGEIAFEGTCLPLGQGVEFEAKIDIAEIFNAYFKEYAIAESDSIIEPIANFSLESQVILYQGEFYIEHSVHIYRGGITNEAFRTLKKNGYDIFTYRLASYTNQFLFTTRTNGKDIKVK